MSLISETNMYLDINLAHECICFVILVIGFESSALVLIASVQWYWYSVLTRSWTKNKTKITFYKSRNCIFLTCKIVVSCT